eukprot:5877497-Lingulodinium_polyedra.AAC.1
MRACVAATVAQRMRELAPRPRQHRRAEQDVLQLSRARCARHCARINALLDFSADEKRALTDAR